VAIEWNGGKATAVTLTGARDETVVVRHGGESRTVDLIKGGSQVLRFD